MIRTVQTQVKNILKVYDKSSLEDINEGKHWYFTANKVAQHFADKYNLTLYQSAGILSALSPGTFWIQNVIDADNFLKNNNAVVSTYKLNKVKAKEILNLTDKDQIYNVLRGKYNKLMNKTSCFYMNIIEPENSDFVTIDRHMIRIANNTLNTFPLTEKRYKDSVKAMQIAGKRLKINPISLQAITWITFRRVMELSQDMTARVMSIDSEIRELFPENKNELPF
ncbi:MAG: DUF7178 family protein [Bacteroidota bacterium]